MAKLHHLRILTQDEAVAIAKTSFHQALAYSPETDLRRRTNHTALNQLRRYLQAAETL